MTHQNDPIRAGDIRITVSAYADGTVEIEWALPCGHTPKVCDDASNIRAMAEMMLRQCDAAEQAAAALRPEMLLPVAGSA